MAAEYACLAVEVVETVDILRHDLSECIVRVAASPAACKRIVHAITAQARTRDVSTDPTWKSAIDALWNLHEAISRWGGYRR